MTSVRSKRIRFAGLAAALVLVGVELLSFIGIGVILAVAKGFPAFGKLLLFLVLNPIGIAGIVGIVIWISVRRRRGRNPPT